MPKTQKQTYRLWTYDLWPDGEGGLMVNNRYDRGLVTIRVKATVYNAGTEHEFTSYSPTDRQLNRAIGARGLTWDGESDYTLYATDKRGDPACELERQQEETPQ